MTSRPAAEEVSRDSAKSYCVHAVAFPERPAGDRTGWPTGAGTLTAKDPAEKPANIADAAPPPETNHERAWRRECQKPNKTGGLQIPAMGVKIEPQSACLGARKPTPIKILLGQKCSHFNAYAFLFRAPLLVRRSLWFAASIISAVADGGRMTPVGSSSAIGDLTSVFSSGYRDLPVRPPGSRATVGSVVGDPL